MTGSDWVSDEGMMDWERLEELDVLLDDDIPIYPYPGDGTEPHYEYTYDHLVDFSKKSIEKYNQDMGKRYQFVELVEALMHRSMEYDTITAYFEACQPDGIIVTFVATTDCPCCPLLQVSLVFLCPDPASFSTSTYPDITTRSLPGKLEAQVELLKVSS